MKRPPRSVLVVVTRRIGDVLLATPVLRSLKQAWPDARIDVLAFAGTEGILSANGDVATILTITERPGLWRHFVFILGLLKRYDLALSLVPGDRPTFYASLAGRRRVGLLLATAKESWKRRLLDDWVPYDMADKHTVLTHLAVLAPLGITPCSEVTVGWRAEDEQNARQHLAPAAGRRYAVLHLFPKFNYKMWSDAAWLELARWLSAHGLRIVLTGGNDNAELAYITRLAAGMPEPLNLSGRLTLNEAACVIAGAAAYVGPDTALTHVAAALGVPTVALFGPTDPLKWAPWPKHHPAYHTPWQRLGNQRVGNVSVVQGNTPCAPCNKEGCDRNVNSYSDCLLALPAERVIKALREVAAIA
jgi:heptosyltransferase-3